MPENLNSHDEQVERCCHQAFSLMKMFEETAPIEVREHLLWAATEWLTLAEEIELGAAPPVRRPALR